MIVYLKKTLSILGVDGAIALTILSRLVQAGGALLSIILVARFLSSNEQGYYYTFGSIIAIQVFFELGLSGIITQYTAHEFAHLKWAENILAGDDYHKSRLSSILHFCVKWFSIVSLVLFFILTAAGFLFFSKFNANANIDWKAPWIILCFATSLNLFIDPILAYFDGLGEVKDMAQVRLIQKSSMIILLFVFLLCGFKLYSSALASLLSIAVNYIQIIFSNRLRILKTIWATKSEWIVSYIKEIFPYQWRIALSWISGYFIFQLFNPVLFATEGPKVAGQMGMTLQVINGISALSMSWITTKVPLFSQFIAKKEYIQLDKTFDHTLKNVLIVNMLLLLVFNLGLMFLKYYYPDYGLRFLSFLPLLVISVTCFVNQLVFSWATYLRCHKQEPFLLQSIVLGILITISTFTFGRFWGLKGIVFSYGILTCGLGLVWSYFIFKSKRSEWHK